MTITPPLKVPNYPRANHKSQVSPKNKHYSTYNIQNSVYTYVFRVTECNKNMNKAINAVFMTIAPPLKVPNYPRANHKTPKLSY